MAAPTKESSEDNSPSEHDYNIYNVDVYFNNKIRENERDMRESDLLSTLPGHPQNLSRVSQSSSGGLSESVVVDR